MMGSAISTFEYALASIVARADDAASASGAFEDWQERERHWSMRSFGAPADGALPARALFAAMGPTLPRWRQTIEPQRG